MEFLKVIESLSLLGGSLYALRWMTGKAEAAAATCDTVRREKDTQIFEIIGKKEDREAQLAEDNRQRLIDLTHEKDAQLDRLRAELEQARMVQHELAVRNAEAFRDIAFVMKDIHANGENVLDAVERIEDIVKQYANFIRPQNA